MKAFCGQVIGQVWICRKGVGVQAGRGAVEALELTDPQQRKALVVVPRLIFSAKERRQVRQDHGLGLATEHVADPSSGVVRLRHFPVAGPDGRRQCFASFLGGAGLELGHGQHQPRTGTVGELRG